MGGRDGGAERAAALAGVHPTRGPWRTAPELRPAVAHPARARRRRRAPAALVVPALAVVAAVNLPLAYLFVRSSEGGLGRYLDTVLSARTLGLVGSTLGLVAGVVTLSLAVAVPLAWLVARTDLPARRLWAVAGALPLVFPSYVSAFALVAVLGPRGYLQGWLAAWFGIERLPGLVYGYGGALVALALFTYPYTYLLAVAALRRTDPALEETSRVLGRGRWRTFFGVVLPRLRPALYAGSLLVALYTLSDFGAVSIVRYDTFTLAIYNAYRGLFDRTVAASLATVLVALTVALIAVEALLARRVRPAPPSSGRPPERVRLGRWRWPALGAVAALALVTLGLPLGVIVYWGARAIALGNPLGAAGGAAAGSLGVSLAAALAAVALALPAAAWAARHPSRPARAVERASHAGYALPGIVIALSLVFFVSRYLPALYQTLAILVAAYVVRFLPEALAAARSAFAAVPARFEEAARSLGRGPLGVLATLTLPLVRPGLAAGGGLVFLTAMKELPATLILRPIGFETLATRVWSAASEAIYSEAALPALLLVAASAAPVYALIIRPALAERGAA